MLRKPILGIVIALLSTGTASAFSGWQVVTAWSAESTTANAQEAYAHCPKGEKILGGGAVVAYQLGNGFPEDPNGVIYMSEPTGGYNGWQAGGVDRTPGHIWAVEATAICARVE